MPPVSTKISHLDLVSGEFPDLCLIMELLFIFYSHVADQRTWHWSGIFASTQLQFFIYKIDKGGSTVRLVFSLSSESEPEHSSHKSAPGTWTFTHKPTFCLLRRKSVSPQPKITTSWTLLGEVEVKRRTIKGTENWRERLCDLYPALFAPGQQFPRVLQSALRQRHVWATALTQWWWWRRLSQNRAKTLQPELSRTRTRVWRIFFRHIQRLYRQFLFWSKELVYRLHF